MPDKTKSVQPFFKNAPIVEVAILAQFDPLENIKYNHLFRLWSDTAFRERYSEIEEYGELPPFFETFGKEKHNAAAAVPLRRPMLRLNLRNPQLDEQFQFQRDRAGFYWQRGPQELKYPRFSYALERFWRDFDLFERFVSENKLGTIRPNQCAVSYNNRIYRGEGWKRAEDLSGVVTFVNDRFNRPPRSKVELEQIADLRVFQIHAGRGTPIARMYVSLGSSQPDAIDLEFTVRGKPGSPDKAGMRSFFQMAHDGIVDLFDAMTTKQMHKRWGKE
jgi:uncharacterized protein (TIGR04255 family)